MKKNIFLLSCMIGAIMLGGCNKDEDFNPSSIEITVTESVDGEIKPVASAAVSVFSSMQDWENGLNQLGTWADAKGTIGNYNYTTDLNGKVRIIGVAKGNYYVVARRACLQYVSDATIAVNANGKETYTVGLTNSLTGRIRIINNSSSTFKVSYVFNNVEEQLFDVGAKSTKSKMSFPIGAYSVKVLQTDAAAGTQPRALTFPGNVGCGTTFEVKIP